MTIVRLIRSCSYLSNRSDSSRVHPFVPSCHQVSSSVSAAEFVYLASLCELLLVGFLQVGS